MSDKTDITDKTAYGIQLFNELKRLYKRKFRYTCEKWLELTVDDWYSIKRKLMETEKPESKEMTFKKKERLYGNPISMDKNLLKFPLYIYGKEDLKILNHKWVGEDNSTFELICNCMEGLPNSFDRNVNLALRKISLRQSHPIDIIVRSGELCELLGVTYSNYRKEINKSFGKLQSATYIAISTYEVMEDGEVVVMEGEHRFHLVESVKRVSKKIRKEKYNGEMVWIVVLSNEERKNLQTGYIQLIETDIAISVKKDHVASRIYELLQLERYKFIDNEYSIKISELAQIIPLFNKNESDRNKRIFEALDELKKDNYIKEYTFDKKFHVITFVFPDLESIKQQVKVMDSKYDMSDMAFLKNITEMNEPINNDDQPTPTPQKENKQVEKDLDQPFEYLKLRDEIENKLASKLHCKNFKIEYIDKYGVEFIRQTMFGVAEEVEKRKNSSEPITNAIGLFRRCLEGNIKIESVAFKKEKELQEKESIEKQRKEENFKNSIDIDLVGAFNTDKVKKHKLKLLESFTENELKVLIDLCLASSKDVIVYNTDGLDAIKRFEAIDAIYNEVVGVVFNSSGRETKEQAIERLKLVAKQFIARTVKLSNNKNLDGSVIVNNTNEIKERLPKTLDELIQMQRQEDIILKRDNIEEDQLNLFEEDQKKGVTENKESEILEQNINTDIEEKEEADINIITGTQLKEAREKAGMTVRKLAEKLEADFSDLSKWEKNKKPIPKKYLPKLKDIFGL